MFDVLNLCDELTTPKADKFVLTNVVGSKNNKNSTVFVFDVVDDYINGEKNHESVIWTYTRGASLPPCRMAIRQEDGQFSEKVANKAVNLGGVQLASLYMALNPDASNEDLFKVFSLDREAFITEMKCCEGTVLRTPMSGRVTGKDGKIRTQFKFPEFVYSDDAEENTMQLEDFATAFSSVGFEEQNEVDVQKGKKKVTVPENATTPVGQQEGDELVS